MGKCILRTNDSLTYFTNKTYLPFRDYYEIWKVTQGSLYFFESNINLCSQLLRHFILEPKLHPFSFLLLSLYCYDNLEIKTLGQFNPPDYSNNHFWCLYFLALVCSFPNLLPNVKFLSIALNFI